MNSEFPITHLTLAASSLVSPLSSTQPLFAHFRRVLPASPPPSDPVPPGDLLRLHGDTHHPCPDTRNPPQLPPITGGSQNQPGALGLASSAFPTGYSNARDLYPNPNQMQCYTGPAAGAAQQETVCSVTQSSRIHFLRVFSLTPLLMACGAHPGLWGFTALPDSVQAAKPLWPQLS